VQVKEKEFGLGEVAPGYRTDLGWKLSAGVTINNVQGMNRQFSIAAQSNLRTSLAGFDLRRKTENKRLPEFTFKTSFIEPYAFHNLLKTQVEFETQASAQRKRFYGFDADIYRISPQLSKSFSKNFIGSLRYQFERIVQFDASESKDNDNFFIGSITPSLTWDLRDDAINTKKGAYFNLSSEWANKYFFSMQNDDLEINYLKVISRNRFYIPMGDVTLAMSISAGYQKNFANEPYVNGSGNTELNSNGVLKTKGYIPSIKLFRLEGYDEVRGFEDSEINVVESGENIGKVVVQDSLYFANFKLEPRYNVTDVFQVGIFFDAGRLYQETFKPLKLRSSVGAGLKFLTPVGSLDFDYGIKLDRKIRNGQQESFGRFHLSIGFF
jgi:outer membrane protein insertion porin family